MTQVYHSSDQVPVPANLCLSKRPENECENENLPTSSKEAKFFFLQMNVYFDVNESPRSYFLERKGVSMLCSACWPGRKGFQKDFVTV